MWVRGYVSTAFGSPFGDAVTPKDVVGVSVKLMEMGCDALSIGDTIGVGVPSQVEELVPLLAERIPLESIAMHFHDTRGTALANVYARCSRASRSSIPRPVASAAAPTHPARPETSAPKTYSISCTQWASRPVLTSHKVRAASRFIARVVDHALTSKAFQAMEAAG